MAPQAAETSCCPLTHVSFPSRGTGLGTKPRWKFLSLLCLHHLPPLCSVTMFLCAPAILRGAAPTPTCEDHSGRRDLAVSPTLLEELPRAGHHRRAA